MRDEIDNVLLYYRSTFLREIPALYEDLERRLGRPVAPFFRMGNWIGGDRDGNPNVDAQTLDATVKLHAETILRHHLVEVHLLGAELSMSRTLVDCSPALEALAEASGDRNPHRADELYRCALIGVYARLAGTLTVLTGGEAMRHAVAPGVPYDRPDELQRDLAIVREFLLAHHGAALAGGRLARLIRAVDVFGFHMATTDLRQSSDQHEAVLGELLRGGADRARLFGFVRGRARRAAAQAAGGPASAARPEHRLFRGASQRTRRVRHGADRARKIRRGGHSPLHHQPYRKRQRPARSDGAAKGMRPAAWHAA